MVSLKEAFARNLRKYFEETGESQVDFAKSIKVTPTAVNDWLHAKRYPRPEGMEKIAQYFGVTTADLIEDNSNESDSEQIVLSPLEINLIKKYRALDERGKQAVDDTLEREYDFVKPKAEESAIS